MRRLTPLLPFAAVCLALPTAARAQDAADPPGEGMTFDPVDVNNAPAEPAPPSEAPPEPDANPLGKDVSPLAARWTLWRMASQGPTKGSAAASSSRVSDRRRSPAEKAA